MVRVRPGAHAGSSQRSPSAIRSAGQRGAPTQALPFQPCPLQQHCPAVSAFAMSPAAQPAAPGVRPHPDGTTGDEEEEVREVRAGAAGQQPRSSFSAAAQSREHSPATTDAGQARKHQRKARRRHRRWAPVRSAIEGTRGLLCCERGLFRAFGGATPLFEILGELRSLALELPDRLVRRGHNRSNGFPSGGV